MRARGPPIQGICADVVYLIRIKFCPSSRLLFSPAESASKLVRIIMFEKYKCGEHLDYYDVSPADTTEALKTCCSCESCTCGGGLCVQDKQKSSVLFLRWAYYPQGFVQMAPWSSTSFSLGSPSLFAGWAEVLNDCVCPPRLVRMLELLPRLGKRGGRAEYAAAIWR